MPTITQEVGLLRLNCIKPLSKVKICVIILLLLIFGSADLFAQITFDPCKDCQYNVNATAKFTWERNSVGVPSSEANRTVFAAEDNQELVLIFSSLDLPAGAEISITTSADGVDFQPASFNQDDLKASAVSGRFISVQYLPENVTEEEEASWEAWVHNIPDNSALRVNVPENDCPGALKLCSNVFDVSANQYSSTGIINDDFGTCTSGLGSGGSVWLRFRTTANGPLDFLIAPKSGDSDYDYVLWEITDGCESGKRVQRSCNFARQPGNTGLSGVLCSENIGENCGCFDQNKGAECNRFNNRVNVMSSREYALNINFFSGTNGGYTLTFANEQGSVSIDSTLSTISNVLAYNCGNVGELEVSLNYTIPCSEINATNFSIDGHTIQLSQILCENDGTKKVLLKVDPPLMQSNYVLNVVGLNNGCYIDNSSFFLDFSSRPTVNVTASQNTLCFAGPSGIYGTGFGPVTIAASGAGNYLWSTGQTTPSISVTPRVTTRYEVRGFTGSCMDTTSTTIVVRQADQVRLGDDVLTCERPVTLVATPECQGCSYVFSLNPTATANGTTVQSGTSPSYTFVPAQPETLLRVVVTDQFGCKSFDDIKVILSNNLQAVHQLPSLKYCKNSNPFPLKALPVGGVFTGNGVVDNIFDPQLAGEGLHEIDYVAINECGSYQTTFTLEVTSDSAASLNLPSDVCLSTPEFNFSPSPACGTVFGPGIFSNTTCFASVWIVRPRFNPLLAGVGRHLITYSRQNNRCSHTEWVEVTRLEDRIVWDDFPRVICDDKTAFPLNPSPAGGQLSGAGVVGQLFDPEIAGLGSHLVVYEINTCSGLLRDSIFLLVSDGGIPINFSYPNTTFCQSQTGTVSPLVAGDVQGTFSAMPAGLSIDTNTGQITPSNSAEGEYSITFTPVVGGGCDGLPSTSNIFITSTSTLPTFNISSNICKGSIAPILPSISQNGIPGSWNPGLVSNTQSQVYTFTPNNDQCAVPLELSITVLEIPGMPIISSNSPVFVGGVLQLNAQSDPDVSFQWRGPANFTSTEQNPQITNVNLDNRGLYRCLAQRGECLGTEASINVNVLNPPVELLVFTEDVEALIGTECSVDIKVKDFRDILSLLGIISFDPELLEFVRVGNFGVPQFGVDDFDLTQVSEGIMIFNWEGSSNHPSGYNLPDSSIFITLWFTMNAAPGVETQLLFSDWLAEIFEEESIEALYSPGRIVSTIVTSQNNHETVFQNVSIAPNPFHHYTTLSSFLTSAINGTINIFDISGKNLYRMPLQAVAGPLTIELGHHLNAGTYFISIDALEVKEVFKVVVIK